MKKIITLVLVFAFLMAGCNVLEAPQTTGPAYVPGELDGPPVEVAFAKTDADLFTDADLDDSYATEHSAVITLSGNAISCDAPSVVISGTTATITRGGTYILRGGLADGSIVIDVSTKDKPHLVLDGAQINSATSAALYVKSAGKVFLTLAKGTQNTLSNGGSFVAIDENSIDGALFSKQDLTINGSGSLTVNSPAGHGIVCKDDLAIIGGTVTVNSAFHAMDANDSVRIKSGNLTMDAGKDGIHVEDADNAATGFLYISGGSLKIEAEGDGISAALTAQIAGCTADIVAGGGHENGEDHSSGYGDFMGGGMGPGGMPPGVRPGGRAVTTADDTATSMKGIKAGAGLLISSGTFTINSADDALHSDAVTVINGGTLELASGDDGIHAETDLSIAAGVVKITKCYEGLEAQNIRLSGGDISLIATDDGLNAAGGMDNSGEGGRDQTGGGMGHPGGMGGAGNGSVVISGGKLYVQASGDGIDANGYLEISGGYTVVCGPNRGDTATLDYDTGATITGGVFIGTGASGMAQTFSSNTQGVLAVSVGGGQSSGVNITVSDSNGKELVSYQPELDFSVIIFSTPELVSGQSYHVKVGNVEGDMTAS